MTTNKRRLLCVEDDEDTCEIVTFLLNDFDVVTAPTGKEAIEKAKSERFALIVMDYYLPDGTGDEVVQLIRTFDPETPIVFHTGAADFTEDRARAVGAQAVVLKGRPDFAIQLQNKAEELAFT